MVKKLQQRFEELEIDSQTLVKTKHTSSGLYGKSEYIDNEQFLTWKVKVKNLLVSACGENSQHFSEFVKNEEEIIAFDTNFSIFKRLKAVFQAAKEDFNGGYLVSVKRLVQAEVFDSELEQAKELLQNGYKLASAVIAGVVLETALRDLCDQKGLPHGKLDKMNSDLAKEGIYSNYHSCEVH